MQELLTRVAEAIPEQRYVDSVDEAQFQTGGAYHSLDVAVAAYATHHYAAMCARLFPGRAKPACLVVR